MASMKREDGQLIELGFLRIGCCQKIQPEENRREHSMHKRINIHGLGLDEQGRCVHYHQNCDVVALKCARCQKYYACFSCHDAMEDHAFAATGAEEEYPVLCGNCQQLLTRSQYDQGSCLYCGIAFNPRCKLHKRIYFK